MNISAEQPRGTRPGAGTTGVPAGAVASENIPPGDAASPPRASARLPDGAVQGYFTRSEKVRRLLWNIVQATLFRFSPRRADAWRAFLLRSFGARVGKVRLLRSTVRVEVPWNVELGDGAQIGDRVYLYSLGPISIGAHTVVSQFSHLCAGTHDFERTDFPLLRVPIRIGERCWIAAESFVGPGVTVGDGVVVGARASVMKDLPAWKVCVGAPARPVSDRILLDPATGRRLDPYGGTADGC
jgi:putative colanic acid biosynthesis acetyltransferase WcaF